MKERENEKKTPKSDRTYIPDGSNTVPNIKPREIDLPPLDPPVPNRAWTEMKTPREITSVEGYVDPVSNHNGVFLENGDMF